MDGTRISRLTALALGAALLASGSPLRADEQSTASPAPTSSPPSAPSQRLQLADVLGQPIFADEIEPDTDRRTQQHAQLAPDEFEAWLLQVRSERLAARIWPALVDRYCRQHNLEPTDAELDAFNGAINAKQQADRQRREKRLAEIAKALDDPTLDDAHRDALKDEQRRLDHTLHDERKFYEVLNVDEQKRLAAIRPQQERRIAREAVLAWKFNKSLYDAYGGRVVFRQAGSEPVEAYHKWLEDHEAQHNFTINDPSLRAKFWESYDATTGRSTVTTPDPFATPWWLLPPPDQEPSSTPQ